MKSISSNVFVKVFIFGFTISSLNATFFNFSTISNGTSSDQEVSDSQISPIKTTEYNFDIFNQGVGGGQSSDLSVWQILRPPDMHADLSTGLYTYPSNSFDDLSIPDYDHELDSHILSDVETSDIDSDFPWEKPIFGHWKGGHRHHHGVGLKNHFPKHKLKKLLKHHRGHYRKHKHYGNYFGDFGSWSDIAHQLSSSSARYYPPIPQFIPFPINFPTFGVTAGVEADILKSLLIPLAGVAMLGAAATTMLITNPFIWSLPFSLLIGHTGLGHLGFFRRRRDVSTRNDTSMNEVIKTKLKEIRVLDEFLQKTSRSEVIIQEKKVLATYLMTQAVCLDRLVCSLHQPKLPENLRQEGIVMSIVTKEILANEYVPFVIRDNILRARQVGWSAGNCQSFVCQPYHSFAQKS